MTTPIQYERATCMLSPLSYSDETLLFYCVPSRLDNIAATDEDAALGFGFVCRALPGADDAVAERLKVLFNREWPADALVSIALWAGPDIGDFVTHFRDLRIGQRDPDLRASAEQRAQFIAEGAERPMIDGMRLRLRNIRVIVTVKVPLAAATPTEKEVADCASLRVDIMQALETVGLAPHPLTADGYVHTLSTLFNHGPNASWRRGPVTADHDKPLREQVIDWDNEIRRDKHGVWLGSTRVRTLSVKRYPDGVSFGQAVAYLCEPRTGARGVFENVLITATMFFPDPQNAKAFLNTKRTWATNQAYGPLLKFEPMLGMKKKGFDVLFQALDDGDRPCRMYLGIALFAPGEDAATAMVANAISYWGELGFHLMADDFISLPLFVNNLPLGADRRAVGDLFRYKTFATRHVIPMLPIFANWTGTGTPVMSLISPQGQPISFNLYDSSTNYNAVICAESGAGKSNFANDLCTSLLSVGAQIWVIDAGKSYKNSAERHGGKFVHFGEDTHVCLNPFPLVLDYSEESDMLVGIVAAMAAPTQPLSDFQTASLKRVMREIWDEKGKAMRVDDVAERCKVEPDQRVKDIGHQLYAFTSRGEYGRYFVGENNVTFQDNFTVIELEELKSRPHLQQVVLLQLIYQIQYNIFVASARSGDNRYRMVLCDEGWDILKNAGEAVTRFLETGWRRFRKMNAAGVFISQGINDLYSSPVGLAITENSATKILLKQQASAIDEIKKDKRLPVSDGAYELMKEIHTAPGRYAQVFVITPSGMGIAYLVIEPFRRLLYSTHPDDRRAIHERMQRGMTLTEAIHDILKQREHGRVRAA